MSGAGACFPKVLSIGLWVCSGDWPKRKTALWETTGTLRGEVDETRPRNQGASLTAWELANWPRDGGEWTGIT